MQYPISVKKHWVTLLKSADKKYYNKGSIFILGVLSLFFILACSSNDANKEVDKLNSISYAFHYRNLDSTLIYADKALARSASYKTGRAEAYNNKAFVCIARMDYDKAYNLLDSVNKSTDNQIELLIADIQNMRLCQRESKNKNFYDYRESALNRFKRIEEEEQTLSEHSKERMIYAKSEFAIVSSIYYYYVGLTRQSVDALQQIEQFADIQKDTAQYLNYLYQVGSGGIINARYKKETIQKEFEHLFKCYFIAKTGGFIYWEANSLQSISEHLLIADQRKQLLENNPSVIRYINEDNMPDSLLPGYIAQKSFEQFSLYGDIYQVAGAYRTLSFCYWELGDYTSSFICLENALNNDKRINQAPDLVASIRELLSLVYSAMNDKNNSDINRNKYLDLQDKTRQDRQLEARAEQLERTSVLLNVLIISIVVLIIVLIVLLFLFRHIRKGKNNEAFIENLLQPLRKWEEKNGLSINELNERFEEINEQRDINRLHVDEGKIRNIDNRAKVFLVTNVVPYIDRIANEVRILDERKETDEVRDERFEYMAELTDKINEFNDVLTHWIQLRQGHLSLRIESFCLKEVFDIIARSGMSFRLKGIELHVEPTGLSVKADKILTLFMLNTLADNARKFTPKGGRVEISAEANENYVEVSVKDTGAGLSEEELSGIFDHKVYNGHGFGLMNCKGIINQYLKVSRIFSVCGLFAESEKGKGSRFYFRLPCGVMRLLLLAFSFCFASGLSADNKNRNSVMPKIRHSAFLDKAGAFADSAYYSNINGTYRKTLDFADSARSYLNSHYLTYHPGGKHLMVRADNGLGVPAEIKWLYENVKTDYGIILDIRNESAVAALALHEWSLYRYNNKVYTSLFKETSADRGLAEYCLTMQRSSANKTIAVIILVLLLVIIVCSYYFFYYRHVLFFRFCVEEVGNINRMLLSDMTVEEKLNMIDGVDVSAYPEPLKNVVEKIRMSLKRSADMEKEQKLTVEIAEDELRRTEYEVEKFYICNNVTDNCLSTLKHETMYYPSRIRQLVDNPDRNIKAISEVVAYYKELYSILCGQIRRQTETVTFDCIPISLKDELGLDISVAGDKTLLRYLFETLKKRCGITREDVSAALKGERYVAFDVVCRDMLLTDRQCQELFSPTIDNIPFLICRQIVRESGELANLHGCGITAEPLPEGGTLLRIILPKALNSDRTNK